MRNNPKKRPPIAVPPDEMQGGFGFYYGRDHAKIVWDAVDYTLRYGYEPKTLEELYTPDSQLQHDIDKAFVLIQHILDDNSNPLD